jgi:hypothetical protein
LIESLVTIVIITTGVVGITGGLAAAERIAGINQEQSQLEVAIRQLADFVRATVPSDPSTLGLQYRLCATPAIYNAHLPAKPTNLTSWSVKTVNVSLTNDGGNPAGNGRRNGVATNALPGGGCSGSTADWGVQEVTLEVAIGSRVLDRVVWKSQKW